MHVLSTPITTFTDTNTIIVNVADKTHSMKLNRLKYRQQVALSKHNTKFVLFDQNRTARLKQKLNQQKNSHSI